MAVTAITFMVPHDMLRITVDPATLTIALRGHLRGNVETESCVRAALRYAATRKHATWTIMDDDIVTVGVEGSQIWANAVMSHLEHSMLKYGGGLLVPYLQGSRDYLHQHSTYFEGR